MDKNYVFHVHTYRCGHASDESEEEYIKRAVEIGAKSITFTDHAPFPGNPFSGRMHFKELEEYISTLENLKMEYSGKIEVVIGLEIEYLPSFRYYYEELRKKMDVLVLGQHHFEAGPNRYSFTENFTPQEFSERILQSQIEGVESKYFTVLAHPGRHIKAENEKIKLLEQELINAAIQNSVVLEKNRTTYKMSEISKNFWEMVPENAKTIYGYDAHCTKVIINE